MNKKVVCIFTCLLLIGIPSLAGGKIREIADDEGRPVIQDFLEDGWLEERDELKILHVKGSPYEMGFQHGYLLKEECLECLRAYLNFSERFGFSYDYFLCLWYQMKDYVPQEYKEEMHGMADGSGVPFEMVAVGNIITVRVHCSGGAAWGPATIDGKLYHLRSLDFPLIMRDPISGKYAQENSVLIIREPSYGYASLDPSFAGFVGSLGGINENGVGVEVLTCWSDDEWLGNPMVFRQRMVLDYAFSVDDAVDILNSNRTCGWNFIVSDGKIPVGFAVEQTANVSYVGTWDDHVESIHPFWEIDHVVRRTNIFIAPATAATQRDQYNPRFFPFLSTLFDKKLLSWSSVPSFVPWLHYKSLSKGLEKHWGKLDLNNTMSMFRDVYKGKTNIVFFLIQKLEMYTTLHQWVACPETGDFVISFASCDKNAFDNPIHYFNLFELLTSEKP